VNGQRLKLYFGGEFNRFTTKIPLTDPWINEKGVELTTLNKRLLGGNPIFYLYYLIFAIYHFSILRHVLKCFRRCYMSQKCESLPLVWDFKFFHVTFAKQILFR
jgi:hypothetical protein